MELSIKIINELRLDLGDQKVSRPTTNTCVTF